MTIEQLEQDTARSFRSQREAVQKTNDRLDKLQTLVGTMLGTQSLAIDNCLQALEEEDKDPEQSSDLNSANARIKKLEEIEADQERILTGMRNERDKWVRESQRLLEESTNFKKRLELR